jgi:hypothetical protein
MTLRINWATYEAAKYACENWHYSKSIPNAKLVKIGVWENDKFIGVVIFSQGSNFNIGKAFNLPMTEIVELTRVALKKHETTVSKIIAIAIKFLKNKCPGIKLIVSYADIDQNHHGGIYQATNWIYLGKIGVGVKTGYLIGGKKFHDRTIFHKFGTRSEKIVKKMHSDLKMCVSKGRHKYIYPLTQEMKFKMIKFHKPYPKRVSSIDSDALSDQDKESGANPTDTLQFKNQDKN